MENFLNSQYGRWLSNPPKGEEVVITGMSARLPESRNIHEFRDNLFNKLDMATPNDRRWQTADHPHIPKKTAKTHDIDKFDAGNFGMHYRQADIMDPMMRMFMETTIEAIMDAGMNPKELEGTKTGVFVGASWSEMENLILTHITEKQKFGITGYLRAFIPQRISYYLKLEGPSCVIDTACSSSLNALETAFRAIRNGQCDNALVGGVTLMMHPGVAIQFFRMGVLSNEGICRVFDQNANGYVRGEAIVSIFLQKSKNSRRIYGKILSARANSDGFKDEGITFPSKEMQRQLITETYVDSGIHPSDFSFYEAHGTATKVGDLEEVEAIDTAIAIKRQKPLLIGSVKSSCGHSEPGSGLCSLVKVLIAMETGQIPPNINFKQIKSGMKGLEEGRMKVVTETTPLEDDSAIIGINNFGFGGSNCHIIIRRFDKKKNNEKVEDIPRLVCCSGRNEEAVGTILNDIGKRPIDSEYVGLYHQIFKNNINSHTHRGYIIISKNGTIESSIKPLPPRLPLLHLKFGNFKKSFKIIGNHLMQFPIFQLSIKRTQNILQNSNINITKILKEDNHHDHINLGAVAVQIGIADILKALQITASEVFGDSPIGNLICAYFKGTLTLKEIILGVLNMAKNSIEAITSNNLDMAQHAREYCNGDISEHLFEKNCISLNISDDINNKDMFFLKNNEVHFLKTLGNLYHNGFNLQLDKLYPEIEYPVSRGTPMISPLIKWNHDKSWYIFKFNDITTTHIQQNKYNISLQYEDYKYIGGHIIDGRNLFPAMGYLYLVWQTFANSRGRTPLNQSVLFENCKFIKAVTMPKSGYVQLTVSIQHGNGNFEVVEKDALIVSGRISIPKQRYTQIEDPQPFNFIDDLSMVLEEDEIYRELYLRGYNYKELFKGIKKCDTKASDGLIKWDYNWVTLMDTMLQMKILKMDSRLLYVPVGIKTLTVDPIKHLELVESIKEEERLLPVHVSEKKNIIRCGGIEIRGLLASSIAKKKTLSEPVLEKYEFVPNDTKLNLNQSTRINLQIVLENNLENDIKIVEIIDDYSKPESKPLLPLISKVLEDVPLINPNLILSSKSDLDEEIPEIKIENFVLSPESKLHLIVGSKILQRPTFLNQTLKALNRNGFILTKEESDLVADNIGEIDILTEHTTENGKLILFKKSTKYDNTKFVEITSDNLEWLPNLQQVLKTESKIVVYSQNQEISGILGLINCIRREPGGNRVRCFFIIDEAPEFDPEDSFYRDQIKKNLAINIYKNLKWGTYRHLLLENLKEIDCEHCYVNSTVRGDLSSLRWIEGPLTTKSPVTKDKVLVRSDYSAINFKDVMIASGRINADDAAYSRIDQECLLGFEFAGKDLRGNRLMGMTNNGTLATLVTADVNFSWPVPEEWSMEDAATVPVVYSTVIYALLMVTDLKPGTSILIHSATGGIGIAALNVALYHQCDIYVTVGTQEKRKFLKDNFPQIPENHIGNSRDTSFEEMINLETKGRGVDIVLNSLSDEKLKASIRCLARSGKLMEIGKYDMANDTSLNLLLMEKERSYHGVMLDQVYANQLELKLELLNKVSEGLRLGYVKPLPRTVFYMDEIEAAFRYMTTGKHIGKILIKIRKEENQTLFKSIPRFHCSPEKSYIIVGGLGGFGLELADWLVLRGAKKLVIVSRSGFKTGYQRQRLEIWKAYGVEVSVDTTDVTTKEGCLELIQKTNKIAAIDGIFNLAVILQDALLEDQTEEKFFTCFAPKAFTTKHLDEITREFCPHLRYFVVFSSVSCGRGNAGQTNYGMANSIMERICEKRKRDGYPALAIQWGAIGDVGLVAKMQKENKELVIGGTLQQKIVSCFEVMDKFLKQDNPVVSSMVVAEKRKSCGTGTAVDTVANIIGIKDIKTVSPHSTLAELGMDSMMGTEVIQVLEKDFEIYITTKDVRSLTFAKLAEIENEKVNSEKIDNKTEEGTNLILQYIPDSNCNLPIIKMSSLIDDGSKGKNIFVFPGIEGVLTPLETIIKNLDGNVFGLQYSYNNPEKTLKDTAENILPHILDKISQDKPFHIIGYSFGAVVALEVGGLLEKRGYFGNITAIDGSPAYSISSIKQYLAGETEAELQTNLLSRIMTMLLPIDIINENKDKIMKCDNFNDRIDLVISLIPDDIINKQRLEKQAGIALYNRFQALLNYKFVHKKLKSSINLFKAKYPMVTDIGDDYQLSEICENSIDVTVLNGDHATILEQPHLVETLNKLIEN